MFLNHPQPAPHIPYVIERISGIERAVSILDEPCQLLVGNNFIQTHCRLVFNVEQFPSTAIKIAELDKWDALPEASFSSPDQLASVKFLQSGFEVEGALHSLVRASVGSQYRHYLATNQEPITVWKPGRIFSIEAVLYNFPPYRIGGQLNLKPEALDFGVPDCQVTLGPLSEKFRPLIGAMTYALAMPNSFFANRSQRGH